MRRWLTAAAALALFGGCTEMPEIEAGTCGNAVVEPDKDEDCDTFAGKGGKCRPPGSEAACHWDCRAQADGSVPACPGGWGCDAQGVCREAAGSFRREGPFDAGDVNWLAVADFDGDSRPDLVSADRPNNFVQARFRLHYLDAAGELSESRLFPKQVTHPLIGRLNEDQTDDLLFADSDLRIGVMLGRHDRSWVPSTFSSYQLDGPGPIRIVSVYDGNVASGNGLGAALALVATFGGESGLFLPTIENGNRLQLLAPLTESLNKLAEPITGNFVEGLDSPCFELVVAFREDSSLRVFDLCEPTEPWPSWRERPVEKRVALPDGVAIRGAPLATDLNADGHLDLLIEGDGRMYVAYGDGAMLEPLMHPVETGLLATDDPERRVPLVVGDFTGDGAPDFVFPDRVTASQRGPKTGQFYYIDVYANQNAPWTVARIADLNADGNPDVVAASANGPDIVYLNGTGELELVPSVIEARSSVPLLAVDDLDGDGVDDLAFVEHDLELPSLDAVKIGFGQLGGPPLPPVQVAQLEGAQQLSAFHQAGIGNLMLASSETIDGRERGLLALLTGSPDRLPFAPFVLVDFAQDGDLREFAALQLALGAFGAPKARDVMALGTPYEPHEGEGVSFWLMRGIERGKGAPRLLEGTMPDGFEALSGVVPRLKVHVASASADLDGDGRDESVWLMPAAAGTRCGLLTAGVDAAGERLRSEESLLLDAPCPAPAISAQDLDGDGSVDLLVGLAHQESGGLLVLWNDRQGRFDAEQSTLIETADHEGVRAWAIVEGQPSSRIALVTDGALWLVNRGAEARSFETPMRTEALTRGKAVTVADLDADGLQDLAVGDAEGLWLLKARFK